jgi:hypothetical protein
MPLSFDLDLVNYSSTDAIQDCINDQTEWINLTEEWKRNPKNRKYEDELKLLLDKYKGLPLVEIIVNENNLPLIENIGIKPCERYPDKKCAFIKPFFCKDKYSSNKSDTEILDSSFFGVLDHTFYETRRRNNPFARKQSIHRTTRKSLFPSTKQNPELVILPLRSSASIPVLKNTTRSFSRKKEAEINNLIQTIRNLQLSLPDHGRIPSITRSRSKSRSRGVNNTSTTSPRITRSKSKTRNA